MQSMRHGVVGVNDVVAVDKARNCSFLPPHIAFLVKDLVGLREELAELKVINKAVSVSNEKLMKSNQKMLNSILLLIDSKKMTRTTRFNLSIIPLCR